MYYRGEESMTHSAKANQGENSLRNYFAAILVVLVFAAASVTAIVWMQPKAVPTLENDTAWLEAHFARNSSSALSEKQKSLIHNSAAIVSAVAQDAGITITLQSVCGNGYDVWYQVDVELPADINARSVGFNEIRLRLNDDSAAFGNRSGSRQTLEDDDPSDHHFPLLLQTSLGYPPGSNYAFDNGTLRTLHLEDLRLTRDNGEEALIEGQWDFDILLQDKGEAIELIQEPVVVRGIHVWKETYYEATMTSFVLTEFSASCRYEATANSQSSLVGLNPVVIMEDGRTVHMNSTGGSSGDYQWTALVPISLDEVAFVKLTDDVVLPFHLKR
jgi:hypothetical protein